MILPATIPPMLAVSVPPFDDPDFYFEIKWDGYRCLIFCEEEAFRLQSRNFKILNQTFPELLSLQEKLKNFAPCVIDGEIIALKNGKPSFLWLQRRQGTFGRGPSRIAREKIPVIFMAFDLLYYKGEKILDLPLWQRKEKLMEIPPSDFFLLSEHIEAKGKQYFASIKEWGLEGMMGKEKNSPYLPGKRSNYWRKCKILQQKPFIICGYVYHPTSRGELRSLILGAYFDGKLTYYGNVGTGMSRQMLTGLQDFLDKTKTDHSPFPEPPKLKNVQWAQPHLVAKVQYLELTEDLQLRHPLFLELLPDIRPEECVMG